RGRGTSTRTPASRCRCSDTRASSGMGLEEGTRTAAEQLLGEVLAHGPAARRRPAALGAYDLAPVRRAHQAPHPEGVPVEDGVGGERHGAATLELLQEGPLGIDGQ